MNTRGHTECPELKPMVTPMRFNRKPPIRSYFLERRSTERIHSQFWQRLEIKRPVARQLQIDQVVDEGISASPADKCRISPIDERGLPPARLLWLRRVWEAPGGGRVPGILNAWIVVGCDAIDDIHVAQLAGVGITNISIVP